MDFEFQLKTDVKRLINKDKDAVFRGLKKGLNDALALLERKAKGIFGRSGALKVRTGYLRRSIKKTRISVSGHLIHGAVGSDVEYAAIHEFGGVIRPVHKKFMVFRNQSGALVFTKRVIMPKRPYLSLAYTTSRTLMRKLIDQAVMNEVRR